MIAGETRFVEIDAYLTALPADGCDGRNLVHLLDGVVQLGRQAAQLVIPVALAPERQRENGNVIDRARLYERRRSPGGIRSRLANIFWFRRTMALSSSSPTKKRTTAMDPPGLEVE